MLSDGSRLIVERLKWRCRRGLLELDLVFERFISDHLPYLSENELDTLEQFLEMPDNDIWDLLTGRLKTSDRQIGKLLELLNSERHHP